MQSKAGRQASTMARHGVLWCVFAWQCTARDGNAQQCKAQHFDTSANLATQGFGKAPHLLALAIVVKELLGLLLAFI